MHPKPTEHNRKKRFKAALAFRGQTAKAWAATRGVTRGHLHQVLAGERESQTLLDAVDAFVREVEGEMAEQREVATAAA